MKLEPIIVGVGSEVVGGASDKDRELLRLRAAAWEARPSKVPREGDFVRFLKSPGVLYRFSYRNEYSSQITRGGSYYLDRNGYCSFSGGLYPSVPYSDLRLTSEQLLGSFWFFHDDYPRAHSAVNVAIPCRLWVSEGETTDYTYGKEQTW